MISWHVPSEGRRDLTNTSIGYIDGVKVYNIVYQRESTRDYYLYKWGMFIGKYYNCKHAIRVAVDLEKK